MVAYLNLTKPRISLLFAITGFAVLVMEKSLLHDPFRLVLIVCAIFLIGGSANSFNQYFERDRDSKMTRTAKKRPLPQGLITPQSALLFSILTGAVGVLILWYWGGWLAALLGLGTILFYSFYYTLWLKPRTPYNIVIGGIAGSTAPLIGWAAVTGQISIGAWILFLIIFFWTPPHFWALALCYKEDYQKVGLPMLPLVAGEESTRKQILYYSLLLFPLSLALFFVGAAGWIYLVCSSFLGILFVYGATKVYREKEIRTYRRFFGYSIIYLMLIFLAVIVDALLLK